MANDMMVKELEQVVVRFSGDSGDGMQLAGNIFSTVSATVGNDISTFPDYPADIRAPQGSLTGVSGFQVHIGANRVYTPGDKCDVLVAMNAAALKTQYKYAKPQATIIIDTDSFGPKDLQKAVLKGKKPIACRPGELLPPADFEEKKKEMLAFTDTPTWRGVLSYCLYPRVLEDYVRQQKEYGYIMRLGSHVFFHGLAVGETNKVNIADGKTLVIKYLGLGDVDQDGMRTVSFELNGIRRDVQVPDEAAQQNIVKVPMADPTDRSQVGASIPGAVSKISVKVGDHVEENQPLMIIEAMKMETAISARLRGTVAELLISEGDTVKGGQLVAVIK